ncbi:MAG: rRNA maturation RNase YbeY [Dehalococcoidales bacterium]|jgi:probable rRNA maturation factor|nr:rRNA maturation RNase YbeY [Dehalococcoidales bacterium]MDX9986513.1 rRNA maturation RNase YbeY [Dehalococcoidales bacterium]NLE90814.1 rRNA maturation RNase YbeY [Dehalococcoidales bacterium]
MEVDIIIDDEYQAQIEPDYLEQVAVATLRHIRPEGNLQLGIVVTGDEDVQRLNREYRGIDATTDVLSFAMQDELIVSDEDDEAIEQFPLYPDGIEQLGEVIISLPQAARQAESGGHKLIQEITILIIHGVLHLLGFDHEADAEAEIMEKHEVDILAKVGGAA